MARIYTLTIFTSALLIFLVQPMMAKILLPYLGGAPAVWNASMVFYQLLLLLGYLYAHLSVKFLGARRQAKLHIILLFTSLLTLPLSLNTAVDIIAAEQPISWLLSVLLVSIGLPFFLLSANAPLLQNWFSNIRHPHAKNPYFLYSASNLGSFMALLSYPFLLEPLMRTSSQMSFWSVLYCLFIGLISLSAFLLHKHFTSKHTEEEIIEEELIEEKPTLKRKLHWIILSFVPSSLMLGVTTFITTDIASIPLIWIIPLSLYLLTFVFAFAPKQPLYENSLNAQIIMTSVVSILLIFMINDLKELLILHLFMFFAISMVCHGQLSKTKPSAKYLTEFFLLISLGGVLGGMFNSLIAPVIFDTIIEYNIVIVLACFMRPLIGKYKDTKKEKRLDIIIPLAFLAFIFAYFGIYGIIINNELFAIDLRTSFKLVFILIFFFLCYKFHRRPVRFALCIASLFIAIPIVTDEKTALVPTISAWKSNLLHIERNFFGVSRVQGGDFNTLWHGTTVHGIQLKNEKLLRPTTYYAHLEEVFAELKSSVALKPVGLIGLGAGTVVCYGVKGQEFDLFEIDQTVINIASNKDYFTFLSDCPPNKNIILGDGRLEIAKKEDGRYGIIIIDAFSSDAIPMHLLTMEAMETYLSKVSEDGLIAFHISNRHLDLEPVLSKLSKEHGVFSLTKIHKPDPENQVRGAKWVVFAKKEATLTNFKTNKGWTELKYDNSAAWTDDYSNIIQLLY